MQKYNHITPTNIYKLGTQFRLSKNFLLNTKHENENVFFKIIIPNYNNMPFIKKCLDSILEQTFQNFKIIIVDDLSTDLSDKFCEAYARKYSDKIIYIQAKEKVYAGGARNIAIDYPLNSEYTWFIDGDDYIETNEALQKLYDAAIKTNADLIYFQYVPEKMNGNRGKNRTFTTNIQYYIDNTQLSKCPWNGPTSKITKSSKVVKFLERCNYGEDTYQWLCFWDTNPTYYFLKELLYIYRQNPNSTIHNAKEYLKHREYFYSKIEQLKRFCKTKLVKDSIQYRIDNFYKKTKFD